MAWDTCAKRALRGFVWMPKYPRGDQMITQTYPWGPGRGFGKSRFFGTLSSATRWPGLNNGNSGAFEGPVARATCARRPLRGFLWVMKYQYRHQMISQAHPK